MVDLEHGDAPRELVIYSGEVPVARIQQIDDELYDHVVAKSLRAFADALEDCAPSEAMDPRDCEFVLDETAPPHDDVQKGGAEDLGSCDECDRDAVIDLGDDQLCGQHWGDALADEIER